MRNISPASGLAIWRSRDSAVSVKASFIRTALGNGLTDEAAKAMGLVAGTAVAAGLIDAHAGVSARWLRAATLRGASVTSLVPLPVP